MSVYAVAQLRNVRMGPAIAEYLQRIDATLEPFEGRFMVHGAEAERIEGNWSGDLIIIEFPDRDQVHGWYGSVAYQAILPLRRLNSDADVIFIDTVSPNHRATDILAR